MNKISDEIKLKVFAQYIGQKVKVTNSKYVNGGYVGTLMGVNSVKGLFIESDFGDGDDKIADCKLILKPQTTSTNFDGDDYDVMKKIFSLTEELIKNTDGSKGDFIYKMMVSNFLSYQYIVSKGIDLPNYLLDGKTLQESELAIYE